MFKSIGKVSALLAGVALAACGDGGSDNAAGTGSVNLALSIPDGQTINTINLDISCPASNVNQSHVLNVANGEAVATFGGLAPGACTVNLASQTPNGTDCKGSESFTVVAGQTVDVLVTLQCQGVNQSPSGSARIGTRFVTKACADDRIQKIFAIPSNVLLGESTLVEVEVNTSALVGPATYSWSVRNDATHTGQGTLATGTCSPTSASCQTFTCTGLGASPGVDPRTNYPVAGVFVQVKVEDDDCFDTEEVWVDCLQASVCGDGTKGGVEQCDDGNAVSGDGCSATCVAEICGDGIIQTGLGEVCDGTVGVPSTPGVSCAADCKSLVQGVACGNGIKDGTEQCDGTAGLQPGQECNADCTIKPICGNGIVEGTEECDSTAANCVACKIQQVNQCATCIAALPDVGPFNDSVCGTDPLCVAARDCVFENNSCWTAIAPAACYCGDNQAAIDSCENPTFVPTGRCANALRAGAGANPTNAEVLGRYFDPGFASGIATIVVDAAFTGSCKAACFQ